VSNSVRSWAIGTAVVCLLVLVAGWMLLIQPKRAEAADTRADASSQKLQNDTLAGQVAVLQKQFGQIDAYKSQLKTERAHVPTDAEIAAFLTEIDRIATAAKVTVVSVAPGQGSVMVAPKPAAPKPTASASASATASPSATPKAKAAAAAAKAATVIPDGMVEIPVLIDVVGTDDANTAFVNQLQTGTTRFALVTGITQTSLKAADAKGGMPKVEDGDVESAINASIFALPAGSSVATPAPTATAKLPVPAGNRNLFAPRPTAGS
jgi:type IV pilus assembly protein PilO